MPRAKIVRSPDGGLVPRFPETLKEYPVSRLAESLTVFSLLMHLDNRGLPLSIASAKAAAAFDHLRPTSARIARFAPVLYPAALFLSALLLFAIQPMFAKMVLPRIGGAAAAWSVAMVFFQGALLLGYAYAHLLSRTLSLAPSALVHLGLLAVAATTLPIGIAQGFETAPQGGLRRWLLALLGAWRGLPDR